MTLTLTRRWREGEATIGELAVDGGFECYTLEDAVRDGPKIPGETAIPAGTYGVLLTYSPRFKCDLPLLTEVPGFEGVRIHPGNTPKDTEGCILGGRERGVAAITESRLAFSALFAKIKGAMLDGEAVSIEIDDAFEDEA